MKTSKKDSEAPYRKLLEPLADQFVRATPERRREAMAGMLPHSAPTPCACWPNSWSPGWTTRIQRFARGAPTPLRYSADASCRPSAGRSS